MPYYRTLTHSWQALRGAVRLADATPKVRGRTCAWARYAASEWRGRAAAAKESYYRWKEDLARRLADPTFAILYVFGPVYGPQALRVASCESGRGIWAQNGQYLGMFQMGSSERAIYGHGNTPLAQAQAAHRYFVASGRDWSPWSCKP